MSLLTRYQIDEIAAMVGNMGFALAVAAWSAHFIYSGLRKRDNRSSDRSDES